jgi:hypothetical protein
VKIKKSGNNSYGFAVLETVTLLFIVAVIAGAGVYVYKHRGDTNQPVADSNVSAPVGTTARTDELNQSEIDQEAKIDDSFDAQRETTAVSDGPAMANLEGASDGSDL